ncbi:hypothetical protein [Isoptericola variabilis]|uniref:hypothetical protein n=1 Tax=Isoptericola variabilis TaxID=139208 RepID=UPI00117FC73F|nr:hypothetical protein [Isoptericola variabilis]
MNDAYDEDWEPIRQANAYRDGLLAKVFVEARARGLVVLEENDAGRPPSELVALADLRAHGLIPDGYADRVRRLAVWMETLDPEGFAQRSAVLADVPSLARWLSLKDRRVHQARARRELESSVAEFRRASHALVSAATGVLRAGRLAR